MGLTWVAPDGGLTNATMVPLVVTTLPMMFDAGPMIACSVFPPDGGLLTRTLVATATPGRYASTMMLTVTNGTWRAQASVGSVDASVTFPVDQSGPTFMVVVLPPPTRVTTADLISEDPGTSPNWNGRRPYRKNERATIRVQSADMDVDPLSVQLTVTGIATPAPTPTTATLLGSCPGGCAQAYCGCFEVDLATIRFDAFRDTLPVGVLGRDRAGNNGNAMILATDGVPVTRWKWSRRLSAMPLSAARSPAIDGLGNVVVGVTEGPQAGTVLSIPPDGVAADGGVNWFASGGAVSAAISIGREDAGSRVYVPTYSGSGNVLAYNSSTGGPVGVPCSTAVNFVVRAAMGLATATTAGQGYETAFFIRDDTNNGFIEGFRPGAGAQCFPTDSVSVVRDFAGISIKGNQLFFANGNGQLETRFFVPGNWQTDAGLGWPTTVAPLNAKTLAVVGMDLVGGGGGVGTGGVFRVPLTGAVATVPWQYPLGWANSGEAADAVVDANRDVFFGRRNSAMMPPTLTRIRVDAASPNAGPIDAGTNITVSAVLGENAGVYTVDSAGTVRSWSAALAEIWRLDRGAAGVDGTVDSAPNIDVARTSTGAKECTKPGVFYVASTGAGRLYAFIVDSKGIDATAPWPKYQHDPRNTGNADTSLTEFSCP